MLNGTKTLRPPRRSSWLSLTIPRLILSIFLVDTEVVSILAVAHLYKHRRTSNTIQYVFARAPIFDGIHLTTLPRRNRITVVEVTTTQTILL